MSKPQLYIPAVAGEDTASLIRWARHAAGTMNEFMRRMATGAFFVWDEGCKNVPTNTTIDGAEELIFESPFTGNGTLIVTGVGFEGDVHVALNGTDLGTLSDPDTSSEILYEVAVTNLIDGLNSFKIWSTSADTGELRRLEAWRNFTKEQLSSAGTTADWGSVTGTGKPDDNADVTSDNPQPWGWVTDDGFQPDDLADVTTEHAAEVIFEASSLPSPAEPGWLVYLTSADGGFSADTWVRRNDANTAWIKVGAHDALELINGPNESGADQTALHATMLADNPTFEAGNVGWSLQDASISNDPTNARRGSWVLAANAATGTTASARNSHDFPVEPGERYLIIGFAKSTSGADGTGEIRLRYKDSSGSEIGSTAAPTVSAGTTYRPSRGVITIPSLTDIASANVEFVVRNNTTGSWFFDDAFAALVPQDSDIDALQTTNPPAEAGADVTSLHSNSLDNPSFEAGDTGWTKDATWSIVQADARFGSWSAEVTNGASADLITNDVKLQVEAGDRVLAQGFVKRTGGDGNMLIAIRWRDSAGSSLSFDTGNQITSSSYAKSRVVAIAPTNAETVEFLFEVAGGTGTDGHADGAYMAIVPQDADIDALSTTNAPAESGADVTGNNTANDVQVGGGRNVEETNANNTETRESVADWETTQTFTPTWSGFSTDPTGTISYAISKDGRWAKLIWTSDQIGTSNDNGFSISGLPSAIQPAGGASRRVMALGFFQNGNAAADVDAGAVRVWEASNASAGTLEFARLTTDGTAGGAVQLNLAQWVSGEDKGILAGTQIMWTL